LIAFDRGVFVHFAYMDDSGTRDIKKRFQVMVSVLINDQDFHHLEFRMGAIAKSVEALIPEEKIDQFEEFHAFELYGGFGVFDGVPQEDRFQTIRYLLEGIDRLNIPIVYGAVDKSLLAGQVYSSANPVDMCFQMCIEGIESWARQHQRTDRSLAPNLVLLIVDETSDKEIKGALRKSFRRLRQPLSVPVPMRGQAWHLHDDMYFGSSKESMGLQTADLCGFFIQKHLIGTDPVAETFYKIIENHIVHQRREPRDKEQS